ncbi:glycosyltransferase family 4 protein [Nisaea acidiphila]|uniref:Glycosyltransferase family 4 protein n=1 Tax=Nisaea acidiphila TaxID=1862145 RepID=A0A9J7AKY3_9PROT|nr:glycosyltransferase family 4 protein [Nisaea acidiphila]UUX48152.1 glycosyltransferase family 4 protein [Nisaea acidiphila]
MGRRTALFFAPERGDSSRLVGRQVANEGFLKAYMKHGAPGAVPVYAMPADFDRFEAAFPTGRELMQVPASHPRALADCSGLFMPGPALAKRAWHRRGVGRGRYSLSGVTHAMSSERAAEAVRDMLIAPMAEWDALICTSEAIQRLVQKLAGDYADSLGAITGGRPPFLPQLPVIPLGVDTEALASIGPVPGENFRKTHGIGEDTFVLLFLGRLSYHTKAHPIPMYRALNLLTQRLQRPVTLIEAGWYYNSETEAAFDAAARTFAPQVRILKIDARDRTAKDKVLSAADAFISLVDNAQESFGITPVEAMAAGLPAIVSDWDGYRDTVVDGETGFRIPTLMPPSGAGYEYAWRLASEQDDYDLHMGLIAQHVAVDIPKTVEALSALAEQPEKARAMGVAAAARARAVYDWRVIVGAYDALWRELEERRAFYAEEEPHLVPQITDPFATFAGFASGTIAPPFGVRPVDGAEMLLEQLAGSPIAAVDRRSLEDGKALVAGMREQGPMVMEQEFTEQQVAESARTFRALAWLLKMGVIERI